MLMNSGDCLGLVQSLDSCYGSRPLRVIARSLLLFWFKTQTEGLPGDLNLITGTHIKEKAKSTVVL